MSIEDLLECEYPDLRTMIVSKEPVVLESLKDNRMKNKLINPSSKYELIWLSQQMPDEAALMLFDDEGLKLLSGTRDLVSKMNGIMTCCKPYVNSLLNKDMFCSIIVKYFQRLNTYLSYFDVDGAVIFAKYIQENNPDMLEDTILSFSVRIQKDVVERLDLSLEMKRKIVARGAGSAAEYLLKNDPCFIHLNDYYFNDLFHLFSSKCTIPKEHLYEDEFIKKFISMYDVKDYRFLINSLLRYNDVEEIEKRRRQYYSAEINSFNYERGMLQRFSDFFDSICKLMDEDKNNYEQLDELYNTYFNFFGSGSSEWNIRWKIKEFYNERDKAGLAEFLSNESNLQLSNIIIDYHFQEVPFNFFLDVKQLLHFQQGEGRTLTDEYLEIYSNLLNIDNLEYEEKLKLHKRLLQEDFVSKHYDVFREAKDKSSQLIKEQMLTPETIKKYYNEELSDYCGVPVYVLDGQDFIAFVKSTIHSKSAPLNLTQMTSTVDGGSYSLDGSAKLNTYKDPRQIYNLIFGDFPISQIIHTYPVDSCSKYVRTSETKATSRVNELYTPQELVEKSSNYNEIILAQKNELRRGDELNDGLGLPTLMGIYCYDQICVNDVRSAKNLGVGIVVVRTKSYSVSSQDKMSMFDTLAPSYNRRYAESIDYLTQVNEDDMINRRKI